VACGEKKDAEPGDAADTDSDTDADTDTDTDADTDADTDTDTDTDIPFVAPPGEASVVLLDLEDSSAARAQTLLFGMFVVDGEGIWNFADCEVIGLPCIDGQLPLADDTFADLTTLPWNRIASSPGRVGAVVTFANNDMDFDYGIYFGDPTYVPGDSVGFEQLDANAEWGAWSVPDVLIQPDRPASPTPLFQQPRVWSVGGTQSFAWTAGGAGDPYLWLIGDGLDRIYRLADDGDFTLDLDDLGLDPDQASNVFVILGRWSFADVLVNGNPAHLQARAEIWGNATWEGAVAPLAPSEACGGSAPVGEGRFWFTVDGFAPDLDPGVGGCTGKPAPGPDAVVDITVPAGNTLLAEWSVLGGDTSLYAVTDCLDLTTCIDGSDEVDGDDRPEFLIYTNTDPAGVDLSVALDSPDANLVGDGILSIWNRPEVDLVPIDTCADAMTVDPYVTGHYGFAGTLAGKADDLDLVNPGPSCTGYESSGADGVLPIQLSPGETVSAWYNQRADDGSLYLLTDCTDTTTTLACEDAYVENAQGQAINAPERVTHHNDTGALEIVYLVIDGYQQARSFDLMLDIE
jgi:hypothetical protein